MAPRLLETESDVTTGVGVGVETTSGRGVAAGRGGLKLLEPEAKVRGRGVVEVSATDGTGVKVVSAPPTGVGRARSEDGRTALDLELGASTRSAGVLGASARCCA